MHGIAKETHAHTRNACLDNHSTIEHSTQPAVLPPTLTLRGFLPKMPWRFVEGVGSCVSAKIGMGKSACPLGFVYPDDIAQGGETDEATKLQQNARSECRGRVWKRVIARRGGGNMERATEETAQEGTHTENTYTDMQEDTRTPTRHRAQWAFFLYIIQQKQQRRREELRQLREQRHQLLRCRAPSRVELAAAMDGALQFLVLQVRW